MDKNLRNVENVLNYDFRILEKWFNDWLFKFNFNKIKVVFFSKLKCNVILELFF